MAPLILTKHFNFSTITISFFQNLCILGFALGFAFANIALNARKSYLHYLEKAIILLPILMLIDFIVLKYNLNSNILLTSRFLEGIFCGIFLSTISFLIKLELIDYEKNGEINGYLSSTIYFLKFIVPLITIHFIAINGHEENIFLIGCIIYILMIFVFFKNKRNLFYKYQFKILKHNKKEFYTSYIRALKKNLNFFYKKENMFYKIFYLSLISLRFGLRPFFDLYISIYLIKEYNVSLENIALYISLMVFGQSTQLITGRLSDKINLFYYNLIQIIGSTIVFIFIYKFELINNSIILTYLVFFFMGFFRAMYGNYDYKISNFMIEIGKFKINKINFITNVYGEIIHYIFYLIFGLLLIFISLKTLMIIPIIMSILSLVVLFIFDYKFFILKK